MHALHDLTLSIPADGVTAVVGPNGAGKSTLFGLLLGFLRPSAGRVRVEGLEPRRYTRTEGASYLPERFSLPGGWTLRASLRALARLEGMRGRDADARAADAIERFGLAPHAAKPARTLSRGLLQRLGLAQADLGRRALVVLDEPAQGLDPLWRIRLREWIVELAAEGRTVLLASHDLTEVERVADRAVLLDDGFARETVSLAAAPGAGVRYRLVLRSGAEHVASAFPDARAHHGDEADGAAFEVYAADAAELSDRVAALIAAGAVLLQLAPIGGELEERVRRMRGSAGESGAGAEDGES